MGRSGQRVVVTGIGVVSALGVGLEAFWRGLHEGRSPIAAVEMPGPPGDRPVLAALATDFRGPDHLTPREVVATDRFGALVLATGRLALTDAGLRPGAPSGPRSDRVAIVVGTALGADRFGAALDRQRPTRVLDLFSGLAAARLGIAIGLNGPVHTVADSYAAGAVAIGEAFHLVRDGRVDAAVAGGVEAPISAAVLGAFDAIGVLSHARPAERALRPFDVDRDGSVLGEGGAMLVLEARESAERRGARVLAEIRGYAATSDGYHLVRPRPDGRQVARAVRLALADGGLRATEVDYLNAHATGTRIGDAAEAGAIRSALGRHASDVPVAGTKAFTGHPLAASGAIEAAICVLAIERGWAPGTLNLDRPDPALLEQLPGIAPGPIQGPFRTTVTTSMGFGGMNAVLAFSAPR